MDKRIHSWPEPGLHSAALFEVAFGEFSSSSVALTGLTMCSSSLPNLQEFEAGFRRQISNQFKTPPSDVYFFHFQIKDVIFQRG